MLVILRNLSIITFCRTIGLMFTMLGYSKDILVMLQNTDTIPNEIWLGGMVTGTLLYYIIACIISKETDDHLVFYMLPFCLISWTLFTVGTIFILAVMLYKYIADKYKQTKHH